MQTQPKKVGGQEHSFQIRKLRLSGLDIPVPNKK